MHNLNTKNPTTLKFTDDMAETLHTYFQRYEQNGVVRIIANDLGLWLVNPERPQNPQFLGKASIALEESKKKNTPIH